MKLNQLIPFIFMLCCFKISAIEYIYTVDTGYENTNNITQRFDGPRGRVMDYGLGFNLTNSLQKEWKLDLSGQISSSHYSDNDLSNDTRKTLQGIAIYQSSISNFAFTTLADISQAPANRFQTQEVNNTRDQNVYAVMPSYYYAVNSSDRMLASYTFVDFNIEGVEDVQAGQARSSTGQSFLVNYAKRLNTTNVIAFNVRSGQTDFDDDLIFGNGVTQQAVDYDQIDVFLSWVVAGQANQLQFELGKSEIDDQLDRNQSRDSRLVSITRQVNRTNALALSYAEGFNSSLSNIQATNTITVNQQNNNIAAAQESEQYSFRYTISESRLDTNINISSTKLRQTFTENIEERKMVSISMRYFLSRFMEISGRSSILINYSKSKSEFDSDISNIRSNEIKAYGITFNYIYSSNLMFALSYNIRDALQVDMSNFQSIADSKSTLFTVVYSDRGRF